MTLVSNWRAILARSSSIWLVVASLVAMLGMFFSTVTPLMQGMSPVWFAAASALFQTLAIPARIVLQKRFSDRGGFRRGQKAGVRSRSVGVIAGSGIALSAALAFIGGWEGLRQQAYRDVVGVWTVCYGQTKGVKPGDIYSRSDCDQMLAIEIANYEAELDRCLHVPVPLGMKIALVSWTYNVGARAACGSSLVRRANAGDLTGACDELQRWNRAGGRVWRGLTRRRISEMQMCHAALAATK